MNAYRPSRRRRRSTAMGFALRGAVAAALLLGTAHGARAHHPQSAIAAQSVSGNADTALAISETAVAQAPQDAALRAALGQAYIRAGRFEAAATALHDARTLGDNRDRTTLGLALAQIACGQNRAALATLDGGAATIAPAELGLALALAGDAERGIAVLTDGVQAGLNSARLRQNLAYAYALDGRWADARLTAGFDLPPDQLEGRLQQWAATMQSGGERLRIAQLLDVPAAADQGMPAALALNEPEAEPTQETAKIDTPAPLPGLAAIPAAAIVEPIPPVAHPVAAFRSTAAWRPPAHRRAVPAHRAIMNVDYFVQLGTFPSARGANRAKLILAKRYPQLRGHGFLISEIHGHGGAYWRVASSGFDSKLATITCASLRHRGGACFTIAVSQQTLALAHQKMAGSARGLPLISARIDKTA